MVNGKIIKVCGMREARKHTGDRIAPRYRYAGIYLLSQISPGMSYELPAYLPIHTHRVGVFCERRQTIVSMYADRFGLNYVQLHGNESPEYCRSLYSMGIKIIKAFSISHPKDLKNVYKYEKVCDLFPVRYQMRTIRRLRSNLFDWNILHTYNGLLPFLLSGGINSYSANALKGFKHPRLAGYDLNSRFELEPGKKIRYES
ncbi:phosphoribosylanthranilate isomerase [Bacteroides ovatus]|nr:phosphoribosylanthranilate isomerase [Bacteroides ovatus]